MIIRIRSRKSVKTLLSYIYDSYSTLRYTIAIRYLELDLASLVIRYLDS